MQCCASMGLRTHTRTLVRSSSTSSEAHTAPLPHRCTLPPHATLRDPQKAETIQKCAASSSSESDEYGWWPRLYHVPALALLALLLL